MNSRIGQLDQDKRTSQDRTANKKGKELIELCDKSQLVILNGRKLGDIKGKFTCHKYNGSSVVDFIATSYNLYPKINYFRVLDPVWFSDHCPIICSMEVRIYRNDAEIDSEYRSLQELPTKYKWDEEGANPFEEEVAKNLIKEVSKIGYTTPNEVADEYEKILVEFAKNSLKVCRN